jgi:uncharacterized protein (TIRG00374 family)
LSAKAPSFPLSRALRLAVAVGLTGFVLWKADVSAVARATKELDPRWAGMAVLLVLVDRALNAYRWIALLGALSPGSRPPFATVLRIFFVSTFVGTFLPSVGGDIYRAYSLAREQVRVSESAASVLMDRVLGVLSIVVLAIAAIVVVPRYAADPRVAAALGLASAGCLAVAVCVFSESAAGGIQRLAARLPGARLRRIASTLNEAVRRYAHHREDLLKVLIASIGVQVLRVIQAYCLGRGLGIELPIVLYFVFIPLVMLVMQLPVTVAGLGTGQVAFDALFGQVGVPASQAVALSILFIALGFVGNLPGALLWAFERPRAR